MLSFAGRVIWYDGKGFSPEQVLSETITVISSICDQEVSCGHAVQQRNRSLYISHLAWGDEKIEWTAATVYEDMDFRGPATPRAADRLRLRPLFRLLNVGGL